MAKRKIWIISEVFYPDEASTGYIMTSIAKALATNEVHIICGPKGYDNLSINESDANLPFIIHRIKTINLNKNNIIKRLIRLSMLSIGMFLKGLFLVRRNDTVLIVTNPAFIIPLYAIISRLKGNKFFILVHDVFPENLLPSRIVKSSHGLLYRITKRIYDWSYQQANLLIVLGRDMFEVMRLKTNPEQEIAIIENWANIEEISPVDFSENVLVKNFNLENKIVFTFAGNIGRVQGLEFLFRVIKQVDNPDVHFVFVGEGALLSMLKKELEQLGIHRVTFVGSMPRSQQNLFLNAAHFGLVTLSSNMYGLGVPSKSYNIMAAGKPILFIGNKNTEIARMVFDKNCGYIFDENDEKKLVRFLNEMNTSTLIDAAKKGLNARKLAESRYSKEYILKKFREIILV